LHATYPRPTVCARASRLFEAHRPRRVERVMDEAGSPTCRCRFRSRRGVGGGAGVLADRWSRARSPSNAMIRDPDGQLLSCSRIPGSRSATPARSSWHVDEHHHGGDVTITAWCCN
jgi:hypothetical protein